MKITVIILGDSVNTEIIVESSVEHGTTISETSEVFTPGILSCFQLKVQIKVNHLILFLKILLKLLLIQRILYILKKFQMLKLNGL